MLVFYKNRHLKPDFLFLNLMKISHEVTRGILKRFVGLMCMAARALMFLQFPVYDLSSILIICRTGHAHEAKTTSHTIAMIR